jgi:putative resolvase
MSNKIEYIPIREASKMTGICPQTLRKMSDQNKVVSYRTTSGQRRFNRSDLEKMCNITKKDRQTFIKRSPKSSTNNSPMCALCRSYMPKTNFIYARVSSGSQTDDLAKQVEDIKASNLEYESYQIITDISNGINLKRKGLAIILDACVDQTVGNIVIVHKDKLSRFAFDLIHQIVEKAGGRIITIDRQYDHQMVDQELSEDFLSIAKVYCKKSM